MTAALVVLSVIILAQLGVILMLINRLLTQAHLPALKVKEQRIPEPPAPPAKVPVFSIPLE